MTTSGAHVSFWGVLLHFRRLQAHQGALHLSDAVYVATFVDAQPLQVGVNCVGVGSCFLQGLNNTSVSLAAVQGAGEGRNLLQCGGGRDGAAHAGCVLGPHAGRPLCPL